jgi:hypothetical protein
MLYTSVGLFLFNVSCLYNGSQFCVCTRCSEHPGHSVCTRSRVCNWYRPSLRRVDPIQLLGEEGGEVWCHLALQQFCVGQFIIRFNYFTCSYQKSPFSGLCWGMLVLHGQVSGCLSAHAVHPWPPVWPDTIFSIPEACFGVLQAAPYIVNICSSSKGLLSALFLQYLLIKLETQRALGNLCQNWPHTSHPGGLRTFFCAWLVLYLEKTVFGVLFQGLLAKLVGRVGSTWCWRFVGLWRGGAHLWSQLLGKLKLEDCLSQELETSSGTCVGL